MTESDRLMVSVAQGDNSSFERLFKRWNGQLVGWLRRHRMARDSADDLSQEVWMKIVANASEYLPRGKFSSWLFRIARNKLADHFRHEKDHLKVCQLMDDGNDLASRYAFATGDALDRAICVEERERVEEVLPTVPAEQQQVFVLYVFCGLSLPEIAEATETSLPTAKSRLRLAREKIRAALGIVVNADLNDTGFERSVQPNGLVAL